MASDIKTPPFACIVKEFDVQVTKLNVVILDCKFRLLQSIVPNCKVKIRWVASTTDIGGTRLIVSIVLVNVEEIPTTVESDVIVSVVRSKVGSRVFFYRK